MTSQLPRGQRRSALIPALLVPVIALFGWLMLQRLANCPKGIQADFVQEWTSARNYWTGEPIYLPLNQAFRKYFGSHARTELRVNAHPPAAVLVVLPFGVLDFRAAWLSWNVVSLVLLGVSLWLLMRQAGLGYDSADAIPVVALLLASNPLAQQVIEGQMNLVLLALIVAAWAADRQEHQLLAGSLIGFAAAIKLYPAFLLVYFVAHRRWHAAAAFGLSLVAATGIAATAFGSDIFVIYVRDVMPAFAHYGDNLANSSLAGLASKMFVGMPGLSRPLIIAPAAATVVKLVLGLGIAGLCGWKAWRARDRQSADIAFSACVVGMLLASPITWGHSFVLLVMPLLVLWRYASGGIIRTLIAVVTALLWLVRPGWIWNALVPGFQAFTLGIAPARYQVPPLYALTALSFLIYALLALFIIILTFRPVQAHADRYRS